MNILRQLVSIALMLAVTLFLTACSGDSNSGNDNTSGSLTGSGK